MVLGAIYMVLELVQGSGGEGPVAWMYPIRAGRTGQDTISGARLPLSCPVSREVRR